MPGPEGGFNPEQAPSSLKDALRKFRGYKEFQEWIRAQPAERREATVKKVVEDVLESLKSAGGEERPGMSALEDVGEDVIVRTEDPLRVLEASEKHQDLRLAFDPEVGAKYANSVAWHPNAGARGLVNAFSEGQASLYGTMTVMGFRKGTDLTVDPVPGSASPIPGYDRSLVRAAEGTVHPEDWRFVAVRVPIQYFPETKMTAEERDELEEYLEEAEERGKKKPKPKFVFRSFAFSPESEQRA